MKYLDEFRFSKQTWFPLSQLPISGASHQRAGKKRRSGYQHGPSSRSPNYRTLLDLATQIKKSVLISHSQSGSFPPEVALIDSRYVDEIKALVLIEPGSNPD